MQCGSVSSGIKQYAIVKVFILLQWHSLMIQNNDETNFYTSVLLLVARVCSLEEECNLLIFSNIDDRKSA